MSATAVERPRRTQEERRATTRQSLLDASLACLLEDGYAGLTTRRVAARAGVSPATQRVYFPNRASFVAAAVEQLAIELRRQVDELPLRSVPRVERVTACLDELWEICKGPAFQVVAELSTAAPGDENARDGLADAVRGVTRQIALSAGELFPEDIGNPRFRSLIDLAMSSMRGLAMFQPIVQPAELEARWRAMREQLTHLYADLADEHHG